MLRSHPSLNKLPDQPGVYFFLGSKREVLYVGKATSLKDRVRSYFASDLGATRGPQIVQMVERAKRVDHVVTDSVLEALILEAKLIKELKPKYNSRDKDDKSWNYLVVTTHELYPRLLTVRGKDLARFLASIHADRDVPVFGPFVHAGQFKDALKIVRKIFPFFDTKQSVETLMAKHDAKLRFNASIGVCPPLDVTPNAYAKTIRHILLFFEAKKKELVRSLERQMRVHARAQEFEAAADVRRTLEALAHIRDIALLRREHEPGQENSHAQRIEAYDVAHLSGTAMVGVMTVVEQGEPIKAEYRAFRVRTVHSSNDTAALREILTRRLAHTEWDYPRLIVVDGGTAQLRLARSVLAEHGIEIPVVSVVKDEHHRPREIRGPVHVRTGHERDILLANAEAHRFSLTIHRRRRTKELLS